MKSHHGKEWEDNKRDFNAVQTLFICFNMLLGDSSIPQRQSRCGAKSCFKPQGIMVQAAMPSTPDWAFSALFKTVGPSEGRVNYAKKDKATNSLQQQKFDFLSSWKAQKGSQSSPPHATAIILWGQDPLPGSIHCWKEWGQKTREVRWGPRGTLKGCP